MWIRSGNYCDVECSTRKANARYARGGNAAFRKGVLAIIAVLGFQLSATTPAHSEVWKKVGGWALVGSSELRGCTMATKYASGASMFMTATHSATEGLAWEIMVTDKGWSVIDGDSVYPIDIRVLGTDLDARSQEMSGYNRASMTGLFFKYTDASDLSAFIADGIATGSHLSFEFDGNLMGAFSLSGAKTAYDELVKCYEHYSADLVL